MSRTVDERVVQAKFDNSQFDKKIEESMKTLEEFKKSLDLENSAKSFESLEKASKGIDLSHLEKSVDKLQFRFSLLGEKVHSVFNKMISDAETFAKKFTIEPIKMGLDEYEEKMDSIKVAMANTGEPLSRVKDTLEDLNTYADQTIYKFSDMTKNLGTFTAQGVGLEDAASAIKGISNLAAITGASTEAASRAMYNFSQSLAMNKMELRDWRTMENTGMGNETFRKEVIQAAKDLGYFDKQWKDGQNHVISGTELMIEAEEAFRETLKYGWFDKKLQLEVLKRYSGDYVNELTGEVYEIGVQAKKAATEITTFSKLIDVVQESFQSGWAYVWEKIIGDYNQAKALWTELGDAISKSVDSFFTGIKDVLDEWQNLGGRFALIDTIKTAWANFAEILNNVKIGFQQIFPPITGQTLMDFTMKLNNLVHQFKLTETGAKFFQTIGKTIAIILQTLGKALTIIAKILTPIAKIGNVLLGLIATAVNYIYDLLTGTTQLTDKFSFLTVVLDAIKIVLGIIIGVVASVISGVVDFIKEASKLPVVQDIINDIRGAFSNLGITVGAVVGFVAQKFSDLLGVVIKFGEGAYIQNGIEKLDTVLTNLYYSIKQGKGVVKSFFAIFSRDGKPASDKLQDFVNSLLNANKTISSTFGKGNGLLGVIDNIQQNLQAFDGSLTAIKEKAQEALNAGNVVRAGLLGITVGLMSFLTTASSLMNTFRKTFSGIPGLIFQLTNATKALVIQFKVQAFVKITACIIAMAGALALLTKIADGKQLLMAAGALTMLAVAMGSIAWFLGIAGSINYEGFEKGTRTMLALAGAVAILAYSLKLLESVEVNVGLVARLGILISIMASLAILAKLMQKLSGEKLFKGGGGRILIEFAAGILILVNALKKLEELSLEKLTQTVPALFKVMIALGAVGAMTSFINPFAGVGFLGIVAGILLLVKGFDMIANVDPKVIYRAESVLKMITDAFKGLVVLLTVLTIAKIVSAAVTKATSITEAIGKGISKAGESLGSKLVEAAKSFGKALAPALTIIAATAMIAILCNSITKLGKLTGPQFEQGIQGLNRVMVCAGMLFLVLAGLSALGGQAVKSIGGIGAVILALDLTILMFAKLEELDQNSLADIGIGLITVVLALGAIEEITFKLSNLHGPAQASTKAMLGVAALLGAVTIAIGLLSVIPAAESVPAAIELVLLVGLLDAMVAGLQQVDTKPALAATLGISALLLSLTFALYSISNIPWEEMNTKLTWAIGTIAALAVFVGLLGKVVGWADALGGAGALVGMSVALIVVSAGLDSLSKINAQKLYEVGGVFTFLMGVMTVMTVVFGEFASVCGVGVAILLGVSASLFIIAAAFAIFAKSTEVLANGLKLMIPPLVILGNMKLTTAAAGLLAIGTAGILLGVGAPGVMAMGVALGIMNLAMSGIGNKISQIGEGLKDIAVGAYALAKMDLSGIGMNVAKLVFVMGDFALTGGDVKKAGDAYAGAAESLDQFRLTASELDPVMDHLGETCKVAAQKINESLSSLQGIGDDIDGILENVKKLSARIIDELITNMNEYSRNNMPSAGAVAADAFMDGFEEQWDKNVDAMISYCADGINNGVQKNHQQIYDSGMEFGQAFVDGANDGTGVASPSWKMEEMIDFCVDGVNEEVYSTYTQAQLLAAGEKFGSHIVKGTEKTPEEIAKLVGVSAKEIERQVSSNGTSLDNSGKALGHRVATSATAEVEEGVKHWYDIVVDFLKWAGGSLGDLFGGGTSLSESLSSEMESSAANSKYAKEAKEYGAKGGANAAASFVEAGKKKLEELQSKYLNIDSMTKMFGLDNLYDQEFFTGQQMMSDMMDEVNSHVTEVTDRMGDYSDATGGAGKASSKSAKEMAELEAASYNFTQVLVSMNHHFGEFYDEVGKGAFDELGKSILGSEDALTKFKEEWDDTFKSVQSALDNIFDAPKEREFIDKNAVLSNMRENINQVSQWAHELGELSKRAGAGMTSALYGKLRSLGPEGYKYVHAFSEMTDEELQKASDMFEESLTLQTDATTRVMGGYYNCGVMMVQGLAKGLNEHSESDEASAQVMRDGLEAAEAEAEINSPSKKTEAMGLYLVQGLSLGMLNNYQLVVTAAQTLMNRLITELNVALNNDRINNLGKLIITKIATGMMLNADTLNPIILKTISQITAAIETKSAEIIQNGRYICQYLIKGFREEMDLQAGEVDNAIDKLVEFMWKSFEKSENETIIKEKIVEWLIEKVCDFLTSQDTFKTLEEAQQDILNKIIELWESDEFVEMIQGIGENYVAGLIQGIEEKTPELIETVKALGEELKKWTLEVTEEHSPSKFTERVGKFWDEGLANGIYKGKKYVKMIILDLGEEMKKDMTVWVPEAADQIENDMITYLAPKTAKALKRIASETDTAQVKKIVNGIATVFAPIGDSAEKSSKKAQKAIQKLRIKVNTESGNIRKQIKNALKFANNVETDLMKLDGPEKLTKQLNKITKWFDTTDKKHTPRKVLTFLKNVKTAMAPVNSVLKIMTKNFANETNAMLKNTTAMNKARVGLINFGATLLKETKAGEEYYKALEECTKAEEALQEAVEKGEDAEHIAELEEAYKEAKENVPSYLEAITNALVEYRDQVAQATLDSIDLWKTFDKGEGFNATSLIGNLKSQFNGIKEWAAGLGTLATNGLNPAIIKQLADENVESYDKVMSLAAANPKTLAIINKLYEKREKKAKKAAEQVEAALGQAYSKDAEKTRKNLEKMIDDGDKAFMKLYNGNITHFKEFLTKYQAGSKEYTSFITNMQEVTKNLSGVIDAAGMQLYGFADASKDTGEIAMTLYDGLIGLSESFGIVGEEATKSGTYIEDLTSKFQEWMDKVKEGLTISNPFEKFDRDAAYSTEQLKYNMNSQLQAVKDFTNGIKMMSQMGYSSELIQYVAGMGYENGLKYIDGFVNAEKNEVGYFNDAYREVLTIPDSLSKEIGGSLLSTGTELGKSLIEGANQAFKELGVSIPLTDPSAEETQEAMDGAEEVGEDIGEALEDGYEEGFEEEFADDTEVMLISGTQNGIDQAMPTIVKKYSKAGAKANEAYTSSFEEEATKSDAWKQVGKSGGEQITNALTETGTQGVQTFVTSASTSMTKFADDTGSLLKQKADKTANDVLNTFNSAINRINQMINSINTDIRINVSVNTSQADAALDYLNSRIREVSNNATAVATSVSNASSSSSSSGSGSSSGGTSTTTPSRSSSGSGGITIIQNNTSPKALDTIEIYRNTQKLTSTIKSVVGK